MQPLTIESLSVAYGTTTVLEDVDLVVEPGSTVAVLGPSGSGKTTLLRTVCGFVPPASGQILVGDTCVDDAGRTHVPPERRGVGMVFQDYALFAHMTVAENLAFGVRDGAVDARVREMLTFVGLEAFADRRPGELSGGQQQRVALARALAPRPALLLLDEPFANLDASLKGRLSEELRALLTRAEAAALMVTHDREDAFALADRIAVLDRTVLQVGAPEDVYRRPVDAHVAQLTGACSRVTGDADGEQLRTPIGTLPLAVPAAGPRQGSVEVCVRPEDVTLQVDPRGPLEVRSVRFRGRTFRIEVGTGATDLGVDHPERLEPGTRVALAAQRPLWPLEADGASAAPEDRV